MGRNQNFEIIIVFGWESDLFFSFCCSDWPSTGLACDQKTSKKALSTRAIFTMEQPGVAWQEILVWVFCLTFWAFLLISQASLGRSLWTGHYREYLFLLQKLSIDDANFGQKWWRQKWKKGQGSSWPVTGGTGVNGLKSVLMAFKNLVDMSSWQNEYDFSYEQKAVVWLHVVYRHVLHFIILEVKMPCI